jgi:tellurite resistance protein TerC
MPAFAHLPFLGTPLWFWAAFIVLMMAVLLFDLGVFNRKHEPLGVRKSLIMIAGYVTLAALFGAGIWVFRGGQEALDFYTGYVIEYSLSMDNIVMISVILTYFRIPANYQHRVLLWGIIGVLILRGLLITAGSALIHEWSWILLILAAFVVWTGVKMIFVAEDEEASMENSRVVRFLEKHLRLTRIQQEEKFFIRVRSPKKDKAVLYATPLFLALLTIELVDVMFALDSIPAVFAVTTDSFVVFTSNVFAVLGLRTLYFLLAVMVDKFRYLGFAIAAVLIFIGGGVFWERFAGPISAVFSLGVTLTTLGAGVLLSVLRPEKEEKG